MRYAFVTVVLFAIVLNFSELGSPLVFAQQPGVEQQLKGFDALEQGSWKNAIEAFTQAISSDDENADYYTARGVANALAGRLPDAEKDLLRAVRLRDESDRARKPNQHDPTLMWLETVKLMQGEFFNRQPYYPAATQDVYETDVLQLARDFGDPVFRQKSLNEPISAEGKRQQAQAYGKLAVQVKEFVRRAKPAGAAISTALKQRGIEKYKRSEFAAALVDLEPAQIKDPNDVELVFYIAECKRQTGAWEGARSDYTFVLTHRPQWAEAYAGRGSVHFDLGSTANAKLDWEIAQQLGLKIGDPKRAAAESVESANSKTPNSESLVQQLHQLQRSAKDGIQSDILTKNIESFVLLTHAQRRFADETYQRQFQKLEFAASADPSDANLWAELGDFLYQNAFMVLTEWVEPRAQPQPYRQHTSETETKELVQSESAIDKALQLDAKCVKAMALKAAFLMRRLNYDEADKLIQTGLKLQPNDPTMLEVFATELDHSAYVNYASAADLRQPAVWSDWYYTYYLYPSQAELNQAAQYESQARQLWTQARAALLSAAEAEQGQPKGFYYQAIVAERDNKLDEARVALESAVKLQPDFVAAWQFLIKIYGRLKLNDLLYQAQLTSANLSHTTAGPMLKLAWLNIVRTKFTTANKAIDQAAAADPADPRVAAYFGVVARENGELVESAAWFRVAAMIAQANVMLDGIDLSQSGESVLDVDRIGRLVALNNFAGEMALKNNQPAIALERLSQNLLIYQRVELAKRYVPMPNAQFPELELVESQFAVPEAPNLETLTVWSRLRLGEALIAAGKLDDADTQFEWAMNFEQRKPSVVDVGSSIRLPAKLANIRRVEVAIKKRDFNSARQLLGFVGRPKFLPADEFSKLQQLIEQLGN